MPAARSTDSTAAACSLFKVPPPGLAHHSKCRRRGLLTLQSAAAQGLLTIQSAAAGLHSALPAARGTDSGGLLTIQSAAAGVCSPFKVPPPGFAHHSKCRRRGLLTLQSAAAGVCSPFKVPQPRVCSPFKVPPPGLALGTASGTRH